MTKNENLVLVFAKNAELGEAKTRLAHAIGPQNALEVYKILLLRTKSELLKLEYDVCIVFFNEIDKFNFWHEQKFQKSLQTKGDLGQKMLSAFEDSFQEGYKKVVIIGTDLYDFSSELVIEAMAYLDVNDAVIGPATDGGYYLLALKPNYPQEIFFDKNWSTSSLLNDTLLDLTNFKTQLLEYKNDIDTLDDILDIEEFKHFVP